MGVARLTLAALAAVVLLGCGQKTRVKTDYREDTDVEGRDTARQSSDIQFGSATEMQFRDTRAHLRAGRYRQAILSAQSLYRDRGLDRERRAEALLLWAEAEGHALNPGRDLDSATARIELLLQEFGNTDAADEAEEALERMRSFQHDGLVGERPEDQ